MGVLLRSRNGRRVGSREERNKWRLIIGSVMCGLLGLVAYSTTPAELKLSKSSARMVHSVSKSINLISPSTNSRSLLEFKSPELLDSSRNLFDAEECVQENRSGCVDEDSCLVDEELEGACCIPNDDDPENFLASQNCSTIEGLVCPAADLCVAELIPASGVGAQCFREFEKRGGIPLYIFLLVYLFIALAIVCDDYFAYSLDMLGELLGLSSDVKGATFAAIGSSAPELFVSLADNVIAQPPKSVGVGTIVGSAIFNILIIIGSSAIVAGMKFGHLVLDWRPIARDSFFYTISICALIGVALTEEVARQYEGAILVILYGFYLLFMVYNQRIFARVDKALGIKQKEGVVILNPEDPDVNTLEAQEAKAEYERQETTKTQTSSRRGFASPSTATQNLKSKRRMSVTSLGEGKFDGAEDVEGVPYFSHLYWPQYNPTEGLQGEAAKQPKPSFLTRYLGGGFGMWFRRFYFVLVFPINLTFRLTIPDARYDLFREDKKDVKDKRKIGYWLEFIMCIVHIAVLSHFLVFSAAKFGCLVGIDPAIMGLTILAAGTSVPDMITSIILTRNEEGDAAVANSIGSNVFDILIGLGLPWFIADLAFDPAVVATDDIGIAIGFLFAVLIVLLGALVATKFKLNLYIGVFLVALYVFYIIFELAIRPNTIDAEG